MLTLHNQPCHLVVTTLTDFKIIMNIPFNFECRKLIIHPNKRQVYLISLMDSKTKTDFDDTNDFIMIDLRF